MHIIYFLDFQLSKTTAKSNTTYVKYMHMCTECNRECMDKTKEIGLECAFMFDRVGVWFMIAIAN